MAIINPYWDQLAKTDDEKALLKRLRRLKLGQLCEYLYIDFEQEPGDTFASEVLYRVGYEVGHWYEDMKTDSVSYSNGKYPDGITPAMIASAKRWVYDAERILKQPRQLYYGGAF